MATVAPDGSDLRALSSGSQRFQFPAWSPDGSRLAVLGADAEGGFINLLEDAENEGCYGALPQLGGTSFLSLLGTGR